MIYSVIYRKFLCPSSILLLLLCICFVRFGWNAGCPHNKLWWRLICIVRIIDIKPESPYNDRLHLILKWWKISWNDKKYREDKICKKSIFSCILSNKFCFFFYLKKKRWKISRSITYEFMGSINISLNTLTHKYFAVHII